MRLQLRSLALAATSLTFLYPSLICADPSYADNSSTDVPVQHIIDSANTLLAQGDMRGALEQFDAAIRKDPSNYLTLFKRGATYLSLGKSSQASADFDAVLELKPDFEAALLQRAKIKAKAGDWKAAEKDYTRAGGDRTEEVEALKEAEMAKALAEEAEKKGDMDGCVENAGIAIRTASMNLELRSMRARCRFAKGEVYEAVGDLTHVLNLHPSLVTPHLQMASNLYYSLNEANRAIAQIKQCLHFDPESKLCKKIFRRIRSLDKQVKKVKSHREKRQYAAASKILVGHGTGEDAEPGIIDEINADINEYKEKGYLNDASPQHLLGEIYEMACDSYMEMNNQRKAAPHCDATLALVPTSLPALLSKARRLMDADLFEEAIRALDSAKEHHPQDQRLHEQMQKAQNLLRRSKQKDYYKVLGVHRDATQKDIKKAYRKLTKEYHPDKYHGDLSKEDVLKKMGQINEAFEVLNNEELRTRFDNGDDPNDQTQQNPFQQGGHPFGFHQGGGQQFFFQGGHPGGFPGGGRGGGHFKFNF